MRVALIYPPIKYKNEYPLLTQNRQFKFTNSREVRIYPVVMAYLATMLKNDGNEVLYLDGINLRMKFEEFNKKLLEFSPDYIVIETKAPILKKHWEYINWIKENIHSTQVILVGDHIVFYPEESLNFSKADICIAGGDYDFIIRDFIRFRQGKIAKMPSGIFFREGNKIKSSGFAKFYNLNELPLIDRDLTMWHIYGEAYLYHPCGYIMSGRGCGGSNSWKNFKSRKKITEKYQTKMPGLCSFCIWQHSFWRCTARLQSPQKVVDEIENLYKNYKIEEVFDDNESGALWNEEWLVDFHKEMKKRNLIGKISISTNARADSLTDSVCKLLKETGFRLLKIGVESGNLPYPGTPLYNEALRKDWFIVDPKNYEKFDMAHQILKTSINTAKWCKKMWRIHLHPLFIIKSILTLRHWKDIKLALRGFISLLGHLQDYRE